MAHDGKLKAGFTRPVSQNAQSRGQPACEDTHTVALRCDSSGSQGFLLRAMTTASARKRRFRSSTASNTRLPPPLPSACRRSTWKSQPSGIQPRSSLSRLTWTPFCHPALGATASRVGPKHSRHFAPGLATAKTLATVRRWKVPPVREPRLHWRPGFPVLIRTLRWRLALLGPFRRQVLLRMA